MKVIATSTAPKVQELIWQLKQEFNSQYSFKRSFFGPEGAVIVSWWWLTAAQITIHENGIRVKEPSALRTFISTIIRYPLGFAMPLRPWRKNLQKHLVIFLKRKFS